MQSSRIVFACASLALLVAPFLLGANASAQTEITLYDFTGGTNGGAPEAGLIFDTQGNLYGTASGGGKPDGCYFDLGCGTVFELSPATGGGWTLTTLYTFQGGADGANPGGPLLMDVSGNLYGETPGGGGSSSTCMNSECGTVFELSPNGSGGWTKKTLHEFQGGDDGSAPNGALVFDSAGNLYGITIQGGGSCSYSNYGCGTVYELIPQTDGHWEEVILHHFGLSSNDGWGPSGGVVFNAKGDLFGATGAGGFISDECAIGCGTVFALKPDSGKWKEEILYKFNWTDGSGPNAQLAIDSAGNIYGTTYQGAASIGGTVFELSPETGGGWSFQDLHLFLDHSGVSPRVGVVLDAQGNLYGSTEFGGDDAEQCRNSIGDAGCGVIYEMSPTGSGVWTYTDLYLFTGEDDCNYPVGSPVLDSLGNIYETALQCDQTFETGSIVEVTQ
jgi:hypothetical protein